MEASALTVTVLLLLVLAAIGIWVIAVVSFLRFFHEFMRWRKPDRESRVFWDLTPHWFGFADFRRIVRAEAPDDGLKAARTYFFRFVLAVLGFIAVVWLTVGLSTVWD